MDINKYYNITLSPEQIALNQHRDAVGGMWEEIGKLQFDFMLAQGLEPYMRFIDVGCGSFRGGVHFIQYLDAGNYFGIDANESLLAAGIEKELKPAGLESKLSQQNLLVDSGFRFELFNTKFDFALAQSVFTHLPLNHIRLCLIKLAGSMNKNGKFYATFFECPIENSIELEIVHQPGKQVSYPDRDPYHYKKSDFEWIAKELPWDIIYIGDWNHPRAQKMICFKKN